MDKCLHVCFYGLTLYGGGGSQKHPGRCSSRTKRICLRCMATAAAFDVVLI